MILSCMLMFAWIACAVTMAVVVWEPFWDFFDPFSDMYNVSSIFIDIIMLPFYIVFFLLILAVSPLILPIYAVSCVIQQIYLSRLRSGKTKEPNYFAGR